jgi:hypothetical protein
MAKIINLQHPSAGRERIIHEGMEAHGDGAQPPDRSESRADRPDEILRTATNRPAA